MATGKALRGGKEIGEIDLKDMIGAANVDVDSSYRLSGEEADKGRSRMQCKAEMLIEVSKEVKQALQEYCTQTYLPLLNEERTMIDSTHDLVAACF